MRFLFSEYMLTYQSRIFKFKSQLLRLYQWWWWVLQLLERGPAVVLRIYYMLVYILKLMIPPSYSVDVSFQSHKIYSHHRHHEWLLSSETHLCPSATSTLETTPNLQHSYNHNPPAPTDMMPIIRFLQAHKHTTLDVLYFYQDFSSFLLPPFLIQQL